MTNSTPKNDGKDWARRIMDNIKSGRKVSHYAQRCAREALTLYEDVSVFAYDIADAMLEARK